LADRILFFDDEQNGNDTRNYDVGFPVTSQTLSTLGEDNCAVFGQLTYAGIEKWEFTLGARIEYTIKTLNRTLNSNLFPVPPVSDEKGFYNFAPKLAIGYQCMTNVLVYGSTGLGYKPGGFSAYINPPASPAFDTEHNWASEIGVKSAWLDNKLLANVTWFYSDIRDYQVERTLSNLVDLAIINAPRVISTGVELELTARPLRGLELTGMFGYTSAWFSEFTDPETGANLHGKHPPSVPELNGCCGTIPTALRRFARAEWVVVGRTFYTEDNAKQFEQGNYGVLTRGSVGKETCNDWRLRLEPCNAEYYTRKSPTSMPASPANPAHRRDGYAELLILKRQRAGRAMLHALRADLLQTFRQRPVQRHRHLHIEAAPYEGQPQRLLRFRRNSDANAARDATYQARRLRRPADESPQSAPVFTGKRSRIHVVHLAKMRSLQSLAARQSQ